MKTEPSSFFIGLGPAGQSLAGHIRQRPFFPVGKQSFTVLEITDAASLEQHLASFASPLEPNGDAPGQNIVPPSCIFLAVDLDESTSPLVLELAQKCRQQQSCFALFILILPFRHDSGTRQAAESAISSLRQEEQHIITLDRDLLAQRWPQQTKAELEKLATSWVIDNCRANITAFLKKPGKANEQKVFTLAQEPLEQLNLELTEMSAGIFNGDIPSFYRGQNYDFPTFQRLGIKPGD